MSRAGMQSAPQPGDEGGRGRDAARLFVDTGSPDAAPRPGRRLGGHAVVVVVIVLGGGVIYGMRLLGTGPQGALAAATVKYDPKDQQRVEETRFRQAVERLEQSGRPVQLADLEPDASAFEPPPAPEAPKPQTTRAAPKGPDPRAEAARLAEARTRQLTAAAERMRVQSIMQGAIAVARIDGLPVRVGSTIGEFRVAAISADTVTLEAEGQTFERKLER